MASRRRWFQFSLRAMLVLVLLSAVAMALWGVYVGPYLAQRQAIQHLEDIGAAYETRAADGFGWQKRVLGNDFITVPRVDLAQTDTDDDDADYLRLLVGVEFLHLGGTQVSDRGVANLRGFTSLQNLFLYDTPITDAGLAHLAGLTELRALYLGGSQVRGPGLRHLQGLKKLEFLNLHRSQINADDVEALQRALPKLKVSW